MSEEELPTTTTTTEVNAVDGLTVVSQGLKIDLLSLKKPNQFWSWHDQMKLHFTLSSESFWNFVKEDKEPAQVKGVSVEVTKARIKRDVLLSLDSELRLKVSNLSSAHDIFSKLVRLFIGSFDKEKSKITEKLYSFGYTGNLFSYCNDFEGLFSRAVSLDCTFSKKAVTLLFLSKLPRTLLERTYELKKKVEESVTDDKAVFYSVFDLLVDYLQEAKLYDPNHVQKKKPEPKAFQATEEKSRRKRCNYCKQRDHTIEDCKKLAEKKKKQESTSTPKVQFTACDNVWGNNFLIDSGASYHMCGDLSLFKELRDTEISLNTAAGKRVVVNKIGTVVVTLENNLEATLNDCLWYEGSKNVFAIRAARKQGVSFEFSTDFCTIKSRLGSVIYKSQNVDGLNYVKVKEHVAFHATEDVWHHRLNHPGKNVLKQMPNQVTGMEVTEKSDKEVCEGCALGKFTREPVQHKVSETVYQPFEKIVSDCIGPFPSARDQMIGAVILTDSFSNYSWISTFKEIKDVPTFVINKIKVIERNQPNKIKLFQSDNGSEFVKGILPKYLDSLGVESRASIPHVKEENGQAERMNRTCVDNARAALHASGLGRRYWSYALRYAVYVKNRTLVISKGKTPYELLLGRKPDVSHLRVFGCPGFAHVPVKTRKKWDPTGTEIIFLGYSDKHRGYQVMNKKTRTMFISSSVKLKEKEFIENPKKTPPLPKQKTSANSDTEVVELDFWDVPESVDASPTQVQEVPVRPRYNLRSRTTVPSHLQGSFESLRPERGNAFVSVDSRSFKDSLLSSVPQQELDFAFAAVMSSDPKNYKQAMAAPDNESWVDAIDTEIHSLEHVGGLKVVPYEPWMKVIGFLEIYKKKRDYINNVWKYKVRMTARGDKIDDDNIYYSCVASSDGQKVFLIIAIRRGDIIKQADVSTAYLYGRLEAPVYLWLPNGHPKKDPSNKFVYECYASIYGLRQSALVWNKNITDFLISYGFRQSVHVPGMFALEKETSYIYLVLYVDDLMYASNDQKLLNHFEDALQKKYEVKVSNLSSKFVGLEMENLENELVVNQKHMILELAEKHRVSELSDANTPLVENHKLSDTSVPMEDNRKYQSLVGELSYITMTTRPDIAFAVNFLARFNSKPTKELFRIGKRILKYLQSTADYSLIIPKSVPTKHQLVAFCDASFANAREDSYKSVGGYIVFLDDVAVSWKAKKMKLVATSTTEAEYLALHMVTKEVMNLGHMLKEVYQINVFPVQIYCDNKSTVTIGNSDGPSGATKYMATKFYFLKQRVSEGYIKIDFLKSAEQIADGFTKALGPTNHWKFLKNVLKLKNDKQAKRGNVKN